MPRQASALFFVFALPVCLFAAGFTRQGDTAEGSITSSSVAVHEVRLEAQEFFFAQVNGIRMSVELSDASGHILPPTGRLVAAIASHAGSYRLKVRTASPAPQRYVLTINQRRLTQPNDSLRLEAILLLNSGYAEAEQATASSRALALSHYREARQIATSIADQWLEARCLLSESMVHSALGNSDAALEALNDVLVIHRARRDRAGEAYTLNQAALLHAYRSEFSVAFDYYQKALAYWREKNDRAREREVLRNLAIAQSRAGQLQSAIETYNEVLRGFRQSADSYNEAVTLVQISDFYLNLGDFQQALDLATRSLPLHRTHQDKTAEVHALTNAGEALAGQGKHADALQMFDRALRIGRAAGLAWLHVNTQALAGASQEALGRLSRAEALYREALAPMQAHGNNDGTSCLLTRMGLLALRQGQPLEAAAHIEKAAHISQALTGSVARAYALTALSRLERHRGNRKLARQHVSDALSWIERSRTSVHDGNLRATFLASRAASFDLAIELEMEDNNPAAAFAILERFRARGLADMLAVNRIVKPPDPTPPTSGPVIPAATALLSYHLSEERSWLFLLTSEGLIARPLPPAKVFEAQVRLLRSMLAQPSRAGLGRFVQASHELFRLCLGPVLPLIAAKKRLVIAADGPLHYLPFEALLTREPETMAYPNLPYLLSQWSISYAPSAAAFAALQQHPRSSPAYELVAFGDPKGDLPGAAGELQEIAKLFPAGQALVFPGERANKNTVIGSRHLASTRRIHFATHATLGEGSSATSGLLLANGALLTASEIMRENWNAELVVLSACETGLGPRLRGEGILGFTRAVLFAGAAAVAVSLWPVSDESTVALMTDFYRRLSRGESQSEALRLAKLHLLRSGAFAHPYYWAPVVLSGKI